MTASKASRTKAGTSFWQTLESPAEQAGEKVPYELLEGTTPPAPRPTPAKPGVDALTGLPLAQTKAQGDLSTALAATTKSTLVTPERPERPDRPFAEQNAQVPDQANKAGKALHPAVAADQAKAMVPQDTTPDTEQSVAFVAESATTTPTAPANWDSILESWHQLLQKWAQDGSLFAAAQEAFYLEGPNAKPQSKELLLSYVARWSAGNFGSLPPIVMLTNADISGAMGAYAGITDTIYLNRDLLTNTDRPGIEKVLTHELGHFLDYHLNNSDTRGDEGQYFERKLTSHGITKTALSQARIEDDAGTARVNGTPIPVEQAFTQFAISSAYGAAGFSRLDYGANPSSYTEYIGDTAPTNDGGLIVSGEIRGIGGFVVKLTNMGILDPSFGSNGWAIFTSTTKISFIQEAETGYVAAGYFGNTQENVYKLDSAGGILSSKNSAFGGYGCPESGGIYDPTNNKIYLARYASGNLIDTGYSAYNTLGSLSLDSSFGTAGSSIVDAGRYDYAQYSLVRDSQGNLYSCGLSRYPDNDTGAPYWTIISVTNNGGQNTDFSGDGIISENPIASATASICCGLGFNSNGFLMAVGQVVSNYVPINGSNSWSLLVQTLSTSGAIISSQLLQLPPEVVSVYPGFSPLEVCSNGGMYFSFTGTLTNGSSDVFIAKITDAGGLDQSFSDSGYLRVSLDGVQADPHISQQDDGSILLSFMDHEYSNITTVRICPNLGSASFSISPSSPITTGTILHAIEVSSDPNGDPAAFDYQWQTSRDGGTTWANIGNNAASYSVAAADEGNKIQVIVSYKDAQGFQEIVTAPAVIVPFINSGNATFRINGNGTAQESQTLSCSLDKVDPDGMIKSPPPSKTGDPSTGYLYQWQSSSDGLSWTNIQNATNFQYSVNLTSDTNKFLRVQVTYKDDKGFATTIYTDQAKILSGSSSNDKFQGTSGIDITFSGLGADSVATGAGSDFAKGDGGNDTFNGKDGDGNDFFDGGTDTDTLNYSASKKGVDIDMISGVATERATGGTGRDTFSNIENARGTSTADIFTGNTSVNSLTGFGGADKFRLQNAQAFGATTSDHITDFSSDDKIEISKAAFGLTQAYSFAVVSGSTAVNASSALVVYDTSSGYLYLNKDGATAGLGGGGVFCVLDNKLATLGAGQITLV